MKKKSKKFIENDILILPSKSENFGLVIAEAMSYGLPVIVSENTPWEFIEEKKCGWIVKLNEKSIISTIEFVKNLNLSTLKEMGKNGRLLIKDRYGWNKVTTQYSEYYKWINTGGKNTKICGYILKMKLLILGGSGMVGHSLIKKLSNQYEIFSLLRKHPDMDSNQFFEKVLPKNQCIFIDDINEYEHLNNTVKKISPNIMINCIGVIKQRDKNENGLHMVRINSLLPHLLNEICNKNKIKLIHLSTDCVFSGTKGNYQESDNPDPIDEYGESKTPRRNQKRKCSNNTNFFYWS